MCLSVCLSEHEHVRFFQSGQSVNAHICRLEAIIAALYGISAGSSLFAKDTFCGH